MNKYTVTIKFRTAAWDEVDGIEYEVYAVSKSAAIKRVRPIAADDGHTTGRKATFTAVLAERTEMDDYLDQYGGEDEPNTYIPMYPAE